MARSDDYRAAYEKANAMANELRAQASIVEGLDLDGGIGSGDIVQRVRGFMESILGDGRDLLGRADDLLELLMERTRACEAYEAALDRWEAATNDWQTRNHAYSANPVTSQPPGARPVRPTPPGPWAE